MPEVERRVFLSLHENSMPFTQAKLEALGFNGDFADPKFSDAVHNKGVELVCEHSTHNGKATERWGLANWRPEIKPATADKLRHFNAKWKALGGSTQAKPAPPAPLPPTGNGTATRETAWQALLDAQSDKMNQEELAAKWREIIAGLGKPEGEFGGEDWAAVRKQAEVPF